MSWLAIGLVALGAYAAKFAGLVIGPRVSAIRRIDAWLTLLPTAMLAALVVVQTFDGGRRLALDARVVGVMVGTLAALRRAPFVAVVVVAAAATAIVRAL
jgi:hypothetical protein